MSEQDARARLAEVRTLLDEAWPFEEVATTDTATLVARLIAERDEAQRQAARLADGNAYAQRASMDARVVRTRLMGALEHLDRLILPDKPS